MVTPSRIFAREPKEPRSHVPVDRRPLHPPAEHRQLVAKDDDFKFLVLR
jgi:hypothetical protein